jgi:uncharacterized RDD family membrane protein YckC
MRLIRVKAYIIDFLILAIAIFLINTIMPDNPRLNELNVEMNNILSERLDGRISLEEYTERYSIVFHQASLEQQTEYLLYFVFMIGYFVILPYLWKGRTIGCYLCLVQVERFDSGKLRLWQLFIRYSVVFGLGYVLLNNLLLLFIHEQNYFLTISIIAVFQFVIAAFSAITVLYKSEKRGFHEFINNTDLTKIIDIKKKKQKK